MRSAVACHSVKARRLQLWRRMSGTMQFVYDETGQDLLEYALITAFIGVVGILLWENIRTGIGGAYANWDSGGQNLWEPQDPIP